MYLDNTNYLFLDNTNNFYTLILRRCIKRRKKYIEYRNFYHFKPYRFSNIIVLRFYRYTTKK